jgi:hypothetical protein
MMRIATIGLDLAKTIFQVHGVDGMAGFADELMDRGITWGQLVALCAKINKWHVVEMTDERVRIVRSVSP